MLHFLFLIFIKYAALVPLCICLGAYIIKRFIVKFPNKLIPVLNLIVAILLVCIWGPLIKAHWPLSLRIFNGVIYGLCATGLHQIFKQTHTFFRLRKYKKQLLTKKGADEHERNTSNWYWKESRLPKI